MANEEDIKKEQGAAAEDSPKTSLPEAKPEPAVTPETQPPPAQTGNDKPEARGTGDTDAAEGSIIPQKSFTLRRIIAPVIIGLLVVAVIALFARTRSQSQRLLDEFETRQAIEAQVNDLENQSERQMNWPMD